MCQVLFIILKASFHFNLLLLGFSPQDIRRNMLAGLLVWPSVTEVSEVDDKGHNYMTINFNFQKITSVSALSLELVH